MGNSNQFLFRLKKYFLTISLIVIAALPTYSQFEMSSVVTAEVTVNGENGVYDLFVTNNFASTQENLQIDLNLPQGISYISSSVSSASGHSVTETNLASNLFNINSIASGETANITFAISADCEAIDYQLQGDVFRNEVDLILGESSYKHTSSAYNILYAALSIISVSPKNVSLKSGQTVTRTFIIINGGNGAIDNFLLTHSYNSELTIISTSKGLISGDTISFSSADFIAVGDGNGEFNQDETISFDITYEALSCTDKTITSTIKAGWSNSSGFCQNSSTFANTAIDFNQPNLHISTNSELQLCLDQSTSHKQSLTIENTGDGVASDINIDLFKSSGSGYDETLLAKFDISSITYSLNGSSPVSISATSSTNTSSEGYLACLGTNAKGQFIIELTKIEPSDIVTIEWNMVTCAISTCSSPSIGGWAVDIDYADVCAGKIYSKSASGQEPSTASMSMFTESEPDISDGEQELYSFIVSSFENSFEHGPTTNIEVEITIPSGLKITNESDFNWTSAPNTWTQNTFEYNESTGKLVATFPAPEPFTVSKSEITLLLTADCSMDGATVGAKDIVIDINLIRDTNCNESSPIPLVCDLLVSTVLHCPTGNCDLGGIRNTNLSLNRTSFGSPDNNEDGYPDAEGEVDFNKIKRNRIMVGDAFSAALNGVAHTTNDITEWTKVFADVTLPLGNNFELIDATININGFSFQSSNITETTSGESITYTLALENTLLIDNDQISIIFNFKVVGNIGGATTELTSSGKIYTSISSDPIPEEKRYCNEFLDNITLIGYYYAVTNRNNVTVRGCQRNVQQSFFLSIGSCCNNYGGGNLFPYEYRNWAEVATAKLAIPTYYSINKVTLQQYSTRGTNNTFTKTVSYISHDYRNQDTLIFDLSQYYESNQLHPSDDGFSGRIIVNVSPTCDIPHNTYQDFYWAFNFNESDILSGTTTDWYSIAPDRIRYLPNQLSLSSTNPVEDGLTKTVKWNLAVKNNITNETITQPWVHLVSPTEDVQIQQVKDMNTGEVINLTNDLYHLASLGKAEKRNLEITATYSGCSPENLISYAGYACNVLPQSYSEVNCPHQNMKLEVHPKPTQLQVQIDGQTVGDECSPIVQVDLLMSSVRLGAVDSLVLDVTIPSNQSILSINGLNTFAYPNTGTTELFSDPILSGSTYTIPVHELDSSLSYNGLPGVTQIGENKVKVTLQFEMQDNFVPGDFLQFSFNSKRACNQSLPEINLAYDPNISFEETEITGLTTEAGDNWSTSWGDYNNDGFDDLFITDYNSAKSNSLFVNNGDRTFTKITSGNIVTDLASSLASSWADYDNDGDLDIFVANNIGSKNFLYTNNGDGTFTKVTEGHIVNYDGYCHGATWADYNSDGYLDLFVSDFMPTRVNLLYKNLGNGTFQLVTSGDIVSVSGHSIGSSWADVDGDGDPDLFVPNAGETNYFFRNNNGELELEVSSLLSQSTDYSTGGSWGDYDNDSDLDLFVANASNVSNQLFINDGLGDFINSSTIIGDEKGNTHGSTWTDFDNDGDLDLFSTNDGFETNQFYTNNGNGTFSVSENDLNKSLNNSFATAVSDIENDGDLDLFIVNHSGGDNVLFINTKGSCQQSFCMKLVGISSNFNAIGAKVYATATIYGNSVTQYREVSTQTGGGAGSQNTVKVHFGLGDATQIDQLIIKWPSGIIQQLSNQLAGDCITIYEEGGSLVNGYAYLDANDNCSKDLEETILPNQIIRISGREVFTDENGYYQIYLTDGTYNLEAISTSNFTSNCNDIGLNVVGSGTNTYENQYFGFSANCTAPDLSVNMATAAFRRGFGSDLFVNVKNTGGGLAENVILRLAIPSAFEAITSSIPWAEIDNDTLVWVLGNISPEESVSIILRDSVTLDVEIEDIVLHQASISMDNEIDCNPTNNNYEYIQEIVGAIDPNDKNIEFIDGSDRSYIVHNEFVRYKIRFQNIGSYYASRVIIIDTLHKLLDPSTIKNVQGSHSFTYEVEGNIITWVFNDIELPTEENDEEGSNGFVTFEIFPSSETDIGESISNTAHIQFDFEDFIITNEVKNEVLLSHPKETAPVCTVIISPNPAGNFTEISLLGTTETNEGIFLNPVYFLNVTILSPNGSLISSFDKSDVLSFDLPLSSLVQGVYIIQVTDYKGIKYFGKLIKN